MRTGPADCWLHENESVVGQAAEFGDQQYEAQHAQSEEQRLAVYRHDQTFD